MHRQILLIIIFFPLGKQESKETENPPWIFKRWPTQFAPSDPLLSEETRFSIATYALCAKFVLCQLPKPLPGNFDNLISFLLEDF